MDSELTQVEATPEQEATQAKRQKKSFGTFTLFDNFAISHYDLNAAFHKPDKKFLDAVTVGHVLRRGFIDTRPNNPAHIRSRGARLVQLWDEAIRDGLMKVYEQHQAVVELYEQDPIDHGKLFLGEGVTLDIPWNDQRFFYLVRMVLMLDDANSRLRKLLNSGFIDKNVMKRKQRALAQPMRATLHAITSTAAQVHREFKEWEAKQAGKAMGDGAAGNELISTDDDVALTNEEYSSDPVDDSVGNKFSDSDRPIV